MAYPSLRTGPHRQRGAAAVFAAVALMAMLIAMMLAIEIGRLYWAKADLQKQANLAALDAARMVGGCSVGEEMVIPSQSDVEDAVSASLLGNGVAEGALSAITVELGETVVTPATEDEPGGKRTLQTTLAENAEAVRVTLSRPFPTPFLPLFPSQDGRLMVASATAEQAAVGSFYVGSGLLSLDDGILNALLSGLLGGNIKLALVDYNGLAAASVSLAQLATAIGLDVADLSDPLALTTQTPLLSDVLDGLAGALAGTASTTVTGLLQQLGAAAEAGADNPVPIGDLFGPVNDNAVDVPMVNLLDLIVALGTAAHADPSGVSALSLPVVLNIPGVASLNVFLKVLEPPQFSGMGRAGTTQAETAQIRVMVRLQVDALSTVSDALSLVLLGGLLGSVDIDPLNLGIDLEVAKAVAYLDRIQCPRSADPTLAAELSAKPAVAQIKLGTFAGSPLTAPDIIDGSSQLLGVTIKILGGLLSSIQVNLFLDDAVEASAGSAYTTPLPNPVTQYTRIVDETETPYWLAEGVPPDAPVSGENPQIVGTTNILGGALSTLFSSLAISASDPAHPNESSSICLLLLICVPVGEILDAVLDPVVALLGAILSPTGELVDNLLDPLLEMLGIDIGSATVTMNTVAIDTVRVVSMDLPPAP